MNDSPALRAERRNRSDSAGKTGLMTKRKHFSIKNLCKY